MKKSIRDISTIQPNEFIKIENKKQAKTIFNLMGKNGFKKLSPILSDLDGYYPIVLHIEENNFHWQTAEDYFRKPYLVEIPLNASDFIPKKKKKVTRKWVKEYVSQQLAKPIEVNEPESVFKELVDLHLDKLEVEGYEFKGINQWYKAYWKDTPLTQWGLIYIYAHEDDMYSYYGKDVINNEWLKHQPVLTKNVLLQPAKSDEVLKMLRSEYDERGYDKGVVVNSLTFRENYTLSETEGVLVEEGFRRGGTLIMSDGNWAEIISPKEDESIDWGKAGQKVILKTSPDLIIGITGQHNDEYFSGFVLKDDSNILPYEVGRFYCDWSKDKFKILKDA